MKARRFVALLGLIFFIIGYFFHTPQDKADLSKYPPCVTEDSSGPCFWNADTRGNGEGLSFFVEADGTVNYIVKG